MVVRRRGSHIFKTICSMVAEEKRVYKIIFHSFLTNKLTI
jgi:hypothetical protein